MVESLLVEQAARNSAQERMCQPGANIIYCHLTRKMVILTVILVSFTRDLVYKHEVEVDFLMANFQYHMTVTT